MSARFSAVVVARNEEALIQRCLESVAWCDERIVIDMDSPDRTRERATPLATKIVEQEWIPHMEWARRGLYGPAAPLAPAPGRRARGPRIPPAVVASEHGMRGAR